MHLIRPNHAFLASVVSTALAVVLLQISTLWAMLAFSVAAGSVLFAITPRHERQAICVKNCDSQARRHMRKM